MTYTRGRLGAASSAFPLTFAQAMAALFPAATPDQSGFATWDDLAAYIQRTGGIQTTSGFGPMFIAPGGADVLAPVVVYDVLQQFQQLRTNGYVPTADQVVAALGVTGTWQAPGPPPTGSTVPASQWAKYASGVLSIAPQLYNLLVAADPSVAPPGSYQNPVAVTPTLTPLQQAAAAWAAAIAQSALVIPLNPGNAPGPLPTTITGANPNVVRADGSRLIPTAAIVEGPTQLPDGTWYVVYESDPGDGPNYPHLTVVQQAGPSFVPLQDADVYIRPGSCIPLVPGTGPWYWYTALTGSDPANPCTGCPVGWSQGFGLVGPMARQAVAAAYVYGGQPYPAAVTPPDYGDVVPQPAPSTGGGPSARLVPPPNGGVVTQDQDGNIIPTTSDTLPTTSGQTTGVSVMPVPYTPPPVEVGTIDTGVTPAAVSSPALSGMDMALLGAVGLLGLALALDRRR